MAKKSTRTSADSCPRANGGVPDQATCTRSTLRCFRRSARNSQITPLPIQPVVGLAVRGTADQTTLAVEVSLDRTTTTGALKRLQARRFIERAVRRDDRRARACRLTAAAQRCSSKWNLRPARRIGIPWRA